MAKKCANGEGHTRKRSDGRWEGRYTAGYHPETGKRIIKNVLGKTQAECKAKLSAAMEAARGIDVSRADEYTVATWLRSWYEIYAKPNIRISTANRYQLMVEQYTIPRIGNIKLTKLTSRDLQKLYKDLMENGRIDRKSGHGNPGLSSTTVRSLHLMLHSALERAVKERLILRNPTEDCIAPKVQKIEMQILPPEHIKDYLEAADRRGLLPMFYLELVTGLRKGEITALLWSDLDTQNKTISVSKQYIKNPNGELTLSRPKTETSVRKVSIPQEAVDLLICEDTCAGTDIITRGEAADLLYALLTGEFTVAPPPILETIPLNNKEGVHLNSYLLELQKIPEPIRQAFAERGWQYTIDYAYLARLSEERNMSCIGATNYGSRQITVSSAGATVHEFGHFLDELMGFPSQTEGFYQEESGTAAALLRPYALTNEREYFADCFVYWLTYRDNSKKMAALCSAAPKTYAYLLALESQNWQPAA